MGMLDRFPVGEFDGISSVIHTASSPLPCPGGAKESACRKLTTGLEIGPSGPSFVRKNQTSVS